MCRYSAASSIDRSDQLIVGANNDDAALLPPRSCSIVMQAACGCVDHPPSDARPGMDSADPPCACTGATVEGALVMASMQDDDPKRRRRAFHAAPGDSGTKGYMPMIHFDFSPSHVSCRANRTGTTCTAMRGGRFVHASPPGTMTAWPTSLHRRRDVPPGGSVLRCGIGASTCHPHFRMITHCT